MSHCQPYIHLIHLTGLSLIYPLFPGASVSPAHKYICVSQTDPYKNKHKSRLMTSGFPPFKNFSAMPKHPPDTLAGFLTAKKARQNRLVSSDFFPCPQRRTHTAAQLISLHNRMRKKGRPPVFRQLPLWLPNIYFLFSSIQHKMQSSIHS